MVFYPPQQNDHTWAVFHAWHHLGTYLDQSKERCTAPHHYTYKLPAVLTNASHLDETDEGPRESHHPQEFSHPLPEHVSPVGYKQASVWLTGMR